MGAAFDPLAFAADANEVHARDAGARAARAAAAPPRRHDPALESDDDFDGAMAVARAPATRPACATQSPGARAVDLTAAATPVPLVVQGVSGSDAPHSSPPQSPYAPMGIDDHEPIRHAVEPGNGGHEAQLQDSQLSDGAACTAASPSEGAPAAACVAPVLESAAEPLTGSSIERRRSPCNDAPLDTSDHVSPSQCDMPQRAAASNDLIGDDAAASDVPAAAHPVAAGGAQTTCADTHAVPAGSPTPPDGTRSGADQSGAAAPSEAAPEQSVAPRSSVEPRAPVEADISAAAKRKLARCERERARLLPFHWDKRLQVEPIGARLCYVPHQGGWA